MNLNYKILYSDRKTLTISVERDRSIIVRAPRHLSRERIDTFVQRKRLWLFDKLRSKQKFPPEPVEKEFVSGETLIYLGRHYRLQVTSRAIDGIHFHQEFLISKDNHVAASELFKQWYIQKAKEKIIPRVREFAKTLGVSYNRIKISDMRYRWGSCTPSNNLNFNWKLIKAPMFVIDYVIVHELAHLLEPNHTEEFWNIVAVQVPKYEKAKEWLRENGGVLEVGL
jgi:predicted metal-dependent hydrolase